MHAELRAHLWLVERGMPTLAFTADSRQTEAGRLYNRSEEDVTRTPLQKAIDDADYEHGHRVNELLPHRVPLSRDGREEEQLRLQHGPHQQHRQAVDRGQRLAWR